MTSSGMKRGLAVSAISALALTGLPLTAAHADSMADQATGSDSVALYTASNADPGVVSVRNDGVDTKVHLVANGGANVAQVRFSYTHGSDSGVIATVSRTNGVFSAEWSPALNLLGEDVTITR